MATEFARLYRELMRVEPGGKPSDMSYERERRALLATMGHDVGDITTATRPSKHHGRTARSRLRDKMQDSIVVDKKIERMRARQILDVTAQNKEVRELLHSLSVVDRRQQTQGSGSRKMEDSFWTKYSTLFPDGTDGTDPTAHTVAPVKSASKKDMSKIHAPYESSRPRDRSVLRKDFTTNRWSQEERARITALYWEIKKPLMSTKDAWYDYLQEFAARFRSYYPDRSTAEIMDKVKAFVRFRSVKEPGEKEYWEGIRTSSNS